MEVIRSERSLPLKWKLVVLSLLFLFGFVSFAYEIIAQAEAIVYIGSSNIAMGLVISTFILGYLSSIPFGLWADKKKKSTQMIYVFFLIGIVTSLIIIYTGNLFHIASDLSMFLADIPLMGEISHYIWLLITISLTITIVPLLMGGVIPLSIKLLIRDSDAYRDIGSTAGMVFALDSLGSALGGSITAIYLLDKLGKDKLELVIGLSLLILTAVVAVSFFGGMKRTNNDQTLVDIPKEKKESPKKGRTTQGFAWMSWIKRHKTIFIFIFVIGTILSTVLVNLAPIKYGGQQSRFEGVVIYYEKNHYHEIAVSKHPELDLTLYTDMKVVYSQRDHFQLYEPLVHVPMMTLKEPKDVLIVGGGAGGALAEVLKYSSIEKVIIMEEDAGLIKVSKDYFSKLQRSPFSDRRVEVINSPAWMLDRLLNNNSLSEDITASMLGNFDCIIIDRLEPRNPYLTSYYTREFYFNMSKMLNDQGIIISHASSPILKEKTCLVINATMGSVFNHTKLISGDVWSLGPYMYSMGANSPDIFNISQNRLIKKFKEYDIQTKIYTPYNHHGFGLMAMTNNILEKAAVSGIINISTIAEPYIEI